MTEARWKELYKNAVLERDPVKRSQQIETAHQAIHERITRPDEPLSKREFDDIESALKILRLLSREAA